MLIIPLIAVLSAYVFEKMSQGKYKFNFLTIFTLLVIIESISYSWSYYKKPIDNRDTVPQEVYQFLANDKDIFRVFCTTRCLSQKESAIYGLELMDGYGTLSQTNFMRHSWQLTNSYWNYYTLSIPPIGIYTLEQIQPKATDLGTYNVKYVISPHSLTDKDFKLIKIIDQYKIYLNSKYEPRTNMEIALYTPNQIRVNTDYSKNKSVILSEVYSQGWRVFLNGTEKVSVQETPNSLMLVDIKPNTNFVDFKYKSSGFSAGIIITLGTLIFLFVYVIKNNIVRSKSD
jgi:hypothetical protein